MVGWMPVLASGGEEEPALVWPNEEPAMQSHSVEISPRTKARSRKIEANVKAGRLPDMIDESLNGMIHLAVLKLRRTGHKKEAAELYDEWENQWKSKLHLMRGVGDFEPLSSWLSEKYRSWEFIFGKELLYSLRLSDVHSINHEVKPVIFCTGSPNEREYFLHFVHDDSASPYESTAPMYRYRDLFPRDRGPYRGLLPIVSYWSTMIALVPTGFILATPVALGVEWLVKSYVAPRLSEPLWKRVCGINEREIYASNSCSYMEAVRWDAR
jgi:hypothetical protein